MRHYYRTFVAGFVGFVAIGAGCWTALQIAGLPRQAHTVATGTIAGGFAVLVVAGALFLSAADLRDEDEEDDG